MASSVNNPTKVFCICDELEYIRTFIERIDKSKREILSLYASRLGYRVLKENVDNLGSAFQYALFCRMVEYFKEYREKGYLDAPYGINGCALWEENQIADINEILLNPNKYFLSHSKSFEDNRINNYVLNRKIYVREVLKDIINHNKIVIYGAGVIGKELLSYLVSHGVNKSKMEFAVSDKGNNPDLIDDIKVRTIEDISRQTNSDTVVVIAVKEQMQYDICVKLDKLGITNVYSIDAEIRDAIRSISD